VQPNDAAQAVSKFKNKGTTMQNDNQSTKRKGVITHFVQGRNFGFIKSRDPLTGVYETFFTHISNIAYSQPEFPSASDLVEFEISSIPPKPGKYRLADKVHVFSSEPVFTPNALAGASALAGEPIAQQGDAGGAL
jgi:hypothetical protein